MGCRTKRSDNGLSSKPLRAWKRCVHLPDAVGQDGGSKILNGGSGFAYPIHVVDDTGLPACCCALCFNQKGTKKLSTSEEIESDLWISFMKVVPPGFEPGTHGFSVRCSTTWAKAPFMVWIAVAKVRRKVGLTKLFLVFFLILLIFPVFAWSNC